MKTRLGLIGAVIAAAIMPAAADAQAWGAPPPGYYRQVDRRDYDRGPPPGYYERGPDRRGYDSRAYDGRRGQYRGGRTRCDRGTGGTIIGAIAGGLLGNSVAGRGDRGVGTVVGAGVGALAGRAVDRDC